jgi:hypothetical protein
MTAFSRHGDHERQEREDNRKQFVVWSRKGSQIYLTKFAVNRVRTGRGDERRKTKKSNGIYQQCDITGDKDILHIEVQCYQILRLSSCLHYEENCWTHLISTVTSPVNTYFTHCSYRNLSIKIIDFLSEFGTSWYMMTIS